MGYYENIIQEKKNSAEEKHNESADDVKRKFQRGWYRDIDEFLRDARSEGYTETDAGNDWATIAKGGKKFRVEFSGYGTSSMKVQRVEARNSKEEKGYYQSIIEEKEAKQNGPDEDNKFLETIAPILVRRYKRSQAPALTPKEVAILLEERNHCPSTLAQQAVEMWYDHV